MATITVKLEPDHLARVIKTKPVSALAELIWNALDADATSVVVEIEKTVLGQPALIRVVDTGHGMSLGEARSEFEKLGGSWKAKRNTSRKEGRILHGESGEGRFKAFALGNSVTWQSVKENGEAEHAVRIRGNASKPGVFDVDEYEAPDDAENGTVVEIAELQEKAAELTSPQTFVRLCGLFGPYLQQYPGVSLTISGQAIDPDVLVSRSFKTELKDIALDDGTLVDVKLTILEWNNVDDKGIYLCDEDGFTVFKIPARIHVGGYRFTAHASSEYFQQLAEADVIELGEFDPNTQTVLDAVKDELKKYFRQRQDEDSRNRVQEWQEEDIYPYADEPMDQRERTERQVFNIVASSVADYLPGFEEANATAKKFQFQLLRQALEENPASIRRILTEVIQLPIDRQNELAELLEYTTLGNVIRSAKTVGDRLTFLHSLEMLVFQADAKKRLKERRQLHRILAAQAWIFGEQYNLTVDDKSLTEALRVHLEGLGRTIAIDQHVLRDDGSEGIIDLMLSTALRPHGSVQQENLVIELKRPSVKITPAVIAQTQSYAFAVAKDERFDKKNTTWTFWAISNEMSDDAREMARIKDQPEGVVYSGTNGITIWARTWGELLREARTRLDFFNSHLAYNVTDEGAIKLLKEQYARYLPDVPMFQDEDEVPPTE